MPEQVTVLCLGRLGDLLIQMPAFRLIACRTGKPVRVVVSERFSHVLDGASYVEPITVGYDWITGIPQAKLENPGSIIPQFWLDPDAVEFSLVPDPSLKCLNPLTINGRTFQIDTIKDSAFDVAMWRRLGFTRKKMLSTPLVLDRRSSEREAAVLEPYRRANKPLLLVNLVSPSSPFTFLPEVVTELLKMSDRFLLVDLSRIRSMRIYDMLGLYERAAGLVTCDTSTLHLAPATRVPYAAFLADGWRGSTPRGNCVWQCPYRESMDRLTELIYVVSSWDTGVQFVTTSLAVANA